MHGFLRFHQRIGTFTTGRSVSHDRQDLLAELVGKVRHELARQETGQTPIRLLLGDLPDALPLAVSAPGPALPIAIAHHAFRYGQRST
jgi:hypothetical protein